MDENDKKDLPKVSSDRDRRKIIIWLWLICILIAFTVVVGGATRLTNSGLSITEWKPIVGAIPPLSEVDWQKAFALYKQIPEYQIEHPTMDLSGFKFIFLWEYFHRNLGRLLGLVFLIPFGLFLFRRSLSPLLIRKLLIGFSLGALQGILGWLMVTSGLSGRTDVSHYRLAAHLILAFFIFSYFLKIIQFMAIAPQPKFKHQVRVRIGIGVLHSLLGFQIIYGAFVAGLRAGYGYNTFPKMNDTWMPSQALIQHPIWINFVENPAMVQFIHRWIGMALTFGVLIFYFWCRNFELGKMRQRSLNLILVITLTQTSLGILTLITGMQIWLALAHQLGALVAFGSFQVFALSLRTPHVVAAQGLSSPLPPSQNHAGQVSISA